METMACHIWLRRERSEDARAVKGRGSEQLPRAGGASMRAGEFLFVDKGWPRQRSQGAAALRSSAGRQRKTLASEELISTAKSSISKRHQTPLDDSCARAPGGLTPCTSSGFI